jgi:hypothetical protein
MAYQLALIGGLRADRRLIELPFDWFSTFRIEQRFGFNRMTLGCGWPTWPRAWWSAPSSACRWWR